MKIDLVEITLKGSGKKFLLGSVIKGNKDIREAADNLDNHRKFITDTLFYTHITEFIDHNSGIERLSNHRSIDPIYYTGNPSGQRVYFMRFYSDSEPNKQKSCMPIIIRIAVCDKADQQKVLKKLISLKHSQIKSSSGL